ncbi:1228_t:CDS:2 [Dentiscutata heterogama]|uniref:1228_t:CDS:1 n=1 Tax=Dentiscutata heterogama TaxID=1316150 RepID=A0ACA9JY49_9GLOM|nr:1228_t:CDS:2 [Dentiscutata heterogama]
MSVISGSPSSVISLPIQNDYISSINGTQTVMTAATANTILPPDQANIDFKPATTAIAKVNKLKLQVSLDSTIYTAGGILTGRLVLASTTSRSLKLGEISCELTAYEELTTRDCTASQSFLSSRLVFQSTNLPPSNAVYGPKDNGFWTAKKGKTTFPFAFKIPIDAPSSVKYGNNANLKYVVTGVIQFINVAKDNKEDTLYKSKEAFVVEAWDSNNPIYKTPVDAVNMKQLWMGGPGAVMIESSLVETLFQSGGNVSVKVRVKNDTKRRVQGLKVAILQRLLILANKAKKEIDEVKIVGETVAEEWFKDKDFCFDCGEDRTTTVHIHVPKDVRSIRNTALFEVVCYVVVSLKDLTVHLPVNIAHSASLQPVPIANTDLNVFPNHYNMMDENTDFFVEDIRKDDTEVLGKVSSPMNIPSNKGRILPWSDDGEQQNNSPSKGSVISYILGSASPKGLGSLAQSLLGKPKQMSPSTPSKLIAKSEPLAPASPYVYIPAIERVRYLSFTTQEQGVIQKKPFDKSKSLINGFGYYDGSSEKNFPPENESPPSKTVQKCQSWLENQQRDSSPDSTSIVSTEGEKITAQGSPSPWSHINKAQEIASSSSPTTIPFDQQGMPPITIPKKDTILPEDAFQRNNSTVSSPNGPSGLTLLMRSRPSPFVQDDSSSISQSYNQSPKIHPLLVPTSVDNIEDDYVDVQYEEPTIKSDFLQVPGCEQNGLRTPPPAAMGANAGSNLSAIFKWGTSFMGYKTNEPSNQDGHVSSESDPVDQTINISNTETSIEDAAIKARPRRPLPAIPNSAVKTSEISDMQNDKNSYDTQIQNNSQIVSTKAEVVPVTRPRRNLPPIPLKPDISSQIKEVKDFDPKFETSNMSTDGDIPLNKTTNVFTTIEHEVVIPQAKVESSYVTSKPESPPKPIKQITKASIDVTSKPESPPKSTKQITKASIDVTSKPESPPKPTKQITKASIFAALGQKPLGVSTSSAQIKPPKNAPIVSEKKPVNMSPPKQNGFNVPRKPVNRNNPLAVEQNIKSENAIKVDVNLETQNISENAVKRDVNLETQNNSENAVKGDVNLETKKNISNPIVIDNTPLITAARKPLDDDTPLVTIPKPIVNNNSTPIIPDVPTKSIDDMPLITAAKGAINNNISSLPSVITKPLPEIVPQVEHKESKNIPVQKPYLANKFLRKKRRNGKGEEDEGGLTAKIIEPPKQSVSPRIQEFISKYNQATNGK